MTALKILVGHKRPEFALWPGWKFLCADPQGPDDIVLDELVHPDGRPDNSLLSEYYYLFALARKLRGTDCESITLGQYRRLVINAPMGEPASNQPWTSIVSAEAVGRLDMDALTQPRRDGFLISSLVRVDSVANQFGLHHPMRDYFRFLADLVDDGVLENNQIREAAVLNILVPVPSNGTVPVAVFIAAMTTLERAVHAFIRGGYQPRDAYQKRIIAFCLERLHSYLLLLALAQRQIPYDSVAGHQLTIAEGALVTPTI